MKIDSFDYICSKLKKTQILNLNSNFSLIWFEYASSRPKCTRHPLDSGYAHLRDTTRNVA